MIKKQEEQSSGVAMIRIDGTAVRRLREDKGLTQLYMATAVGVTTDTISRWENGRYPSIKKENGVKLAAVLEVDLDAILEDDQTTQPESGHQASFPELPSERKQSQTVPRNLRGWIFAVFFLAAGLLGWLFFPRGEPVSLQSIRHLPAHSPPGKPFPVLVEIITSGDGPVPILVREQLPAGIVLIATVPDASSVAVDTVKWLRKQDAMHQRFGYLVRYTGEMSGSVEFAGSVTLRQGKKLRVVTEGNQIFSPAPYHYADTNMDYRIDDDEILAIHDDFAGLPGFDIGIDEVETIWMGSGYHWNKTQGQFEVLP